MDPLKEMTAVRQIPGEPRRRWFRSEAMDLMVWLEEDGALFGFQLTYDMPGAERVLTWTRTGGFLHTGVDDGECKDFGHKSAPMLVADGKFDSVRVIDLFDSVSAGLPAEIVKPVREKIVGYPASTKSGAEIKAGLMRNIKVVPYDVSWPEAFDDENARILGALGDVVIESHHIGSTSVPGLAAKPLIDILLVVRSHESLDALNGEMETLGYEAAGEYGIPGRRFFRKGGDIARTHHVHAYEPGHYEILRHLVFRDFLRTRPDLVKEYGDLKSILAPLHRNDIEGYMVGKEALIQKILEEALSWKAGS